ncbi:hypothetical protein ACFXGA_18675 [Actinosynnema sp. NPDC059335]
MTTADDVPVRSSRPTASRGRDVLRDRASGLAGRELHASTLP